MLLAGLTTGHKIGLAVVAACFISFALISSFVVSRRRPGFPGKNGIGVFAIACFVLLAAMLTSVAIFGREAKGAEKAPAKSSAPAGPASTIQLSESEFKIVPATASVPGPGKVTFVVKNAGKIQHDLAVQGPGVSASSKTPLINPGGTAKLTVTLAAGTYTLYCTVPGHRAAGMVAKLVVK